MAFGLVIGFIEHLQIVTTSNYNAIANSLTIYYSLQHALSLLSLKHLYRPSPGNGFHRRSFFRFRVHVFTGRQLSHNSLNSRLVLLKTTGHGTHIKHRFQQFFYCCIEYIYHGLRRRRHFPITPLLLVTNLLRPLPSNGCCMAAYFAVVT
jgi:hypothetical protein